jgi:tetratricopeptide (TPR) repeat protein
MTAIFISHSSHDDTFANELKAWLAEQGYERIFLDFDKDTGLRAGENWERRLYEELSRSHAVLLILTPNWLDSKWCFAEFIQARALGKIIFPIIVSPIGEKRVAQEIQGIDLKEWNSEGRDYLRRRIREVTDEMARGFEWDRSRSPFPGINSFEREDAAIYFGRDEEVRDVVERLEAHRVQGGKRLLLVLGASGSGKSSLLKAGVLPQLERDRVHWIVLQAFRPEREPVSALAKVVAERLGAPETWRARRERFYQADPGSTLGSLAQDLRVGGSRNATILISIDQFEEIFTLAQAEERIKFLDMFKVLVNAKDLPYLIVGTLRSDILGDLLNTRSFAFPFESYALRPISIERLRKTIEGPAGIAAITVEPGLPERIAQDVKSSEALPLLAFALRELYERFARDRHGLTIDDYNKLGDPGLKLNPIDNAVRRKADDVLTIHEPSKEQLAALKDAFIPNLVQARDDGTFVRRPATSGELPSEAKTLISALVDARLLVERDGPDSANEHVLEVAHEALFKAWPLLSGWLSDEKEFLAGKAQLQRTLNEWRAAPKNLKHQALLDGLQLRRAVQWLTSHPHGLSKEEIAFIQASQARARRRKLVMASLVGVSVAIASAYGGAKLYAGYVRMTALDCDLLAAEIDNNSPVGVQYDRIDPSRAIPACRTAVSTDPENPRLMHNLGRSLDKAGQFAEAAVWYRKAADLKYDWAENNLGVLYISKKPGVPLDFGKGVALLRAAAEQNNLRARVTYGETDYASLLENRPVAMLVEQALAARGLLKPEDVTGQFGPAAQLGVEEFKKRNSIPDKGVTLRVLDRLGVSEKIKAPDESSRQ